MKRLWFGITDKNDAKLAQIAKDAKRSKKGMAEWIIQDYLDNRPRPRKKEDESFD